MIQTHQVHYYDELLHDIGASIHRKRGIFKAVKEFFEPYRPADYDTIVTGEYKGAQGEIVKQGARQESLLGALRAPGDDLCNLLCSTSPRVSRRDLMLIL